MSTSASLPRRRTIPALTGVRFVAAMWVVLFHFRAHIGSIFPAFRRLESVTEAGQYGVDLFFVLSGFVITYNYADRFAVRLTRQQYGRFLWLRLARMYPVHLATLGVLLLVVATSRLTGQQLANPYGVLSFAKNVFLVNAWSPQADVGWNYPAWSISAEWFAYLLFPLAALRIGRVTSRVVALAGVACSLLLLIAASGVITAYLPLVRVTTEFAAGMFLAHLFRLTASSRRWDWSAALSIVAVPLALIWLSGRLEGAVIVVLFALIIFSLAQSERGVARALSARPLVFLGEASYALYMTHALVEMIFGKLLPMEGRAGSSLAVRALVLAGYTAITLGAAMGTYVLLERPARERLRRASHPLLGDDVPAPAFDGSATLSDMPPAGAPVLPASRPPLQRIEYAEQPPAVG